MFIILFYLGLRSYGKVVYVFTLVPVCGTLVLCTKLIVLSPLDTMQFPATVWSEFFINGKSWVAASNEVFLTWGLLGAAAMQVSLSPDNRNGNYLAAQLLSSARYRSIGLMSLVNA